MGHTGRNITLVYLSLLTYFAGACGTPKFFGLPTWYRYVPKVADRYGNCKLRIVGIDNGYWLIALGILDILLRIAGMITVAYIIYGGFQYIMSQGNPETTHNALRTVTNALIGMIIVIISVALVAFIAGKLT